MTRKMLIGIDGNEANVKERVGSGQYALELLKEFAKSQKHYFIVYLKDAPLPDLPKVSKSFHYKIFGPQKLWTQFALPLRLTLGQKPDVFFSMAHYGPRFSNVPYVVTIHDLSYLHYPELFKKNDLYQLTSWSKYSIKNAAHIIAVSKTTKDDIVKNYNVNPSKVSVTYEGYDNNRFKPQPKSAIEAVKRRYKIKNNYIIFVGTLQPRKNIECLIDSFHKIIGNWKLEIGNYQLVIAGKKGWLYDSIFQKVKDLDLESKVIFTDYAPDLDLPALISGAKVYVLPSLWEGFGIPVIEAQACGVPVVVSNTSSLPEIIGVQNTPEVGSDSSGVGHESTVAASGVLIDPESINSIASGIKKVLTDPKIRADLISSGYQNIKRFSWQKCAKKTLQVLTKTKIS